MNRKFSFTNLLLIGAVIASCACQKERGYTGFVDPDSVTREISLSVSTDKACYAPGEAVRFTATANPVGSGTHVRYLHLGKILQDELLTSAEWTWTAPSEDFKGYMAEVYQTTAEGDLVIATVGIDVSSDWSRFPRYGFLSKYGVMSEAACKAVISNLNRHHINGVQFQDWHWKHHWPLGGTRENPLETYKDIASRTTSLTTIRNYVSAIHAFGMKAIFYNLCFGALDDALEDGVDEKWYIFKDDSHKTKDVHALSAPFKSSIYLVNPGNAGWQQYIGAKTDDVYAVIGFDGYQIDQLGYRGKRYDYDGQEVNLRQGYASFIKEMKRRQPSKELIMNAVSGYGAEKILGTGDMCFAYDEMWANEPNFTDLRTHIENNYDYGGDKCKTVFAAYMNHDKAGSGGTFNTPGVLLADAVIFALGGSHLELGEHMLCNEYFPNSSLGMSAELKEALVHYYDFLTAYENILRDGGELNEVSVASSDGSLSFKSWEPETGKVVTLGRKTDKRQIVHLLNFLDANSLSWRDLDGSMPEPRKVENIGIKIVAGGPVAGVWTASPDIDGGACRRIEYDYDGDIVSLTVPSLKYWDMIVIEYD